MERREGGRWRRRWQKCSEIARREGRESFKEGRSDNLRRGRHCWGEGGGTTFRHQRRRRRNMCIGTPAQFLFSIPNSATLRGPVAKRGGIGLLEMQRSSHATLRERPRPKRVAKFRPEFCVLTRSGRGANTEGGGGGNHHQPSTHTNEFHACRGPPPISPPSFSRPAQVGAFPPPFFPLPPHTVFSQIMTT